MHIIRSETLRRRLAGAKSHAKSLAESVTNSLAETHSETLGETFGETLGETFRARQASPQNSRMLTYIYLIVIFYSSHGLSRPDKFI